jgi:hypothetical protein
MRAADNRGVQHPREDQVRDERRLSAKVAGILTAANGPADPAIPIGGHSVRRGEIGRAAAVAATRMRATLDRRLIVAHSFNGREGNP